MGENICTDRACARSIRERPASVRSNRTTRITAPYVFISIMGTRRQRQAVYSRNVLLCVYVCQAAMHPRNANIASSAFAQRTIQQQAPGAFLFVYVRLSVQCAMCNVLAWRLQRLQLPPHSQPYYASGCGRSRGRAAAVCTAFDHTRRALAAISNAPATAYSHTRAAGTHTLAHFAYSRCVSRERAYALKVELIKPMHTQLRAGHVRRVADLLSPALSSLSSSLRRQRYSDRI